MLTTTSSSLPAARRLAVRGRSVPRLGCAFLCALGFISGLTGALAGCGAAPPAAPATVAAADPGDPAAPAAGAATGEATVGVVLALANHYQASGGAAWARVAFLEQRGSIAASKLSGELSVLEDVRTGRSSTRYTLGPVSGAEGFDGQVHWRLDPAGEVVLEDSAEAVARGKTSAWLARRGFLDPASARLRWLGPAEDAGKRYVLLEATPEGGAAVQLWFDEATGLLARTRLHIGLDPVVTYLDDYRPVALPAVDAAAPAASVLVPMRLTVDSGDPRNLTTMVMSTAVALASAPAEAFARPKAKSDHLTFSGGARETELPFELINNHIYVRATVNGQPVRLLVDTGGINILTKEAIKRLGLTADGTMAARGAGTAQVDVSFAKASTLQLGALQVRDPLFYVFDFTELVAIEDVAFDGLVGFELFHRFIVRIDYAAGKLRLTDPAAFTAPTSAPPGAAAVLAVPFVLEGRVPLVEGTIDGVAARFTIDTGSRASLTAASPFVAKHGLVEKHKPPFSTITGWGVGGAVRSSPMRFAEVKLGKAVLRDVLGDLYTGEHGAFADPRSDANVGGGILRRFTVTFDYGKRLMYLEPNAHHAEPDRYDRSGLFLLRRAAGVEVAAVAAGSPAERAGVKVGDLIFTVDGVYVGKRPLAAWRAKLRDSAPGTKVQLIVQRNRQKQRLTLTLAELIP